MTKLHSAQVNLDQVNQVNTELVSETTPLELAPEPLLDAASLDTVLTMLEVIDSAEDLALLETLTLDQKRQVWDATPSATRLRLKQLKMAGTGQGLSPSVNRSYATGLIDAAELQALPEPEPSSAESSQEETAAIDLEAQREEVDLMLQEPLDLTVQPTVTIGDWVVLHAKPKLTKVEMQAIWEVIEVQGNYARIVAPNLGARVFPTGSMTLYPKPINYVEPEF